MWRKLMFVVVIAVLIGLMFALDLNRYVSLTYLKSNLDAIRAELHHRPIIWSTGFFVVYVLFTALSIPAASILTLAAGALFGLFYGSILVSFASSIGATLAFWTSRYMVRDLVRAQFVKTMSAIDRGMEREGNFYLFALRLVPIFPFFLVNLLMGLTSMRTTSYYWISQLGMLPATIVYVNAGVQLSTIENLAEIFSPHVALSLAALGIMPLIFRYALKRARHGKLYAPYAAQKPRHFDYDIVTIGAGSAGLVSAYIGASVKARVLLIEKSKMGGDCLNTGCVPSKALIRAAHLVHEVKNSSRFGIAQASVNFNFADIMERVGNVIKQIEPHDSIERYQQLGVHCMQGAAKITSPWTVTINNQTLSAKNIIIASGAEPFVPPIPGIHEIDYLTSETLWQLRDLPKRLLIVGGGPIGCELAQAFARLGSHVTQIEMAERILLNEDPEVSAFISQTLSQEGVTILTGHEAKAFQTRDNQSLLVAEHRGLRKELIFDRVVLAVGRKARTEGYGLLELGIELRKNGTVDVNDYLQTKYPNIYACGDVTGPYQFTHMASHQAWYCAVNALFGTIKTFRIDYRVTPWCTYTDPEIATVGLTEQAAIKSNTDYEITSYNLDDLDRAIIDGADHGFIRILTAQKSDRILGVTIVAKDASNLIMEFVTAMKHGLGLKKILSTIHVYPSFGEANKYAAGVWQKNHISPRLLRALSRYFAWRRN